MTGRIAWASSSVAIVGLAVMTFLFLTYPRTTTSWLTGPCSRMSDPVVGALPIVTGIVAFFALGYLALGERRLRWRIPELILSVVLMLPATSIGVLLDAAYTGCGTLLFWPAM